MNYRIITSSDWQQLAQYYRRNHDHFRRWEPIREHGFHSNAQWQQRIHRCLSEQQQMKSCYYIAIDESLPHIVGHCTLSQMVYGPFRAAYMGYGIDQDYEGQGIMYTLCQNVIQSAFGELGLHRIMANYMPKNHRSAALLERLGFTIEGRAQGYLHINGRWEDHILTALVNTED
ncbi:GNAT family N-acetyltransferase [Marinibactrum halimedae]|uniref:Ribosomal protein S5 alanine N-acetyltransferase n=1 Tax=Marinibactrum halimedae TaxID=1444977 RepID=A0AA37T5U1_9GAMM|nr:GNAT family N-acetyltransferase [Marinibactrum halimedae]MCD9457935.1 GNAT family N-acetyltransferase [Marinibactrum halimedae]GLS26236.1 ribosomal protein S5 alanine N-acetyltransferase [Marinibactrum halimedae]